jgi:hypothetical protein
MRRRNIFKVSLAYAIVSWLIAQVADVLLPTFNAPQWIMQALVLVLMLLFPIAVLLSWAYELTPQGFKPSADVDRTQSITMQTGKRLNYVVIFLLSLAVVFLVLDNYIFPEEVAPDPDVAYRQSVAVLPFQNRSAAEENAEFLADGIHDELITMLAQINDGISRHFEKPGRHRRGARRWQYPRRWGTAGRRRHSPERSADRRTHRRAHLGRKFRP